MILFYFLKKKMFGYFSQQGTNYHTRSISSENIVHLSTNQHIYARK